MREEVQSLDLNLLMERDSYRKTRLHRAAFYGDTEMVDTIFEKIRQNRKDKSKRHKCSRN